MGQTSVTLQDLDERATAIFRAIVETYLKTGAPVGSRYLSRSLPLSAASIRNVMADLEEMGVLFSPHSSAGRLPTDPGLRLFIDGLLEVGDLTGDERRDVEARVAGKGSVEDALHEASRLLSGLGRCAGLVVAPKQDGALKHMEFVSIAPDRALVVLVSDSGLVENRVIQVPAGMPPAALTQASNYINARLQGRSMEQARAAIQRDRDSQQAELSALASGLVEQGLATWSRAATDAGSVFNSASDGAAESSGEAGGDPDKILIIHGRSHLLEDITAAHDLERIRRLFDDLEHKRDLLQLLQLAQEGDGFRIFIGSETPLFSLSGSALVASPYTDARQNIVGAVGVIGPTRLNYARIIPMVNYTARMITRLLT